MRRDLSVVRRRERSDSTGHQGSYIAYLRHEDVETALLKKPSELMDPPVCLGAGHRHGEEPVEFRRRFGRPANVERLGENLCEPGSRGDDGDEQGCYRVAVGTS